MNGTIPPERGNILFQNMQKPNSGLVQEMLWNQINQRLYLTFCDLWFTNANDEWWWHKNKIGEGLQNRQVCQLMNDVTE